MYSAGPGEAYKEQVALGDPVLLVAWDYSKVLVVYRPKVQVLRRGPKGQAVQGQEPQVDYRSKTMVQGLEAHTDRLEAHEETRVSFSIFRMLPSHQVHEDLLCQTYCLLWSLLNL